MRKHLSAIRENQVGSLSQEDPLEKGMATHSSIFSWSISCTEEPGGLWSMGHKELDTNEQLHFLSYFVLEHGANRGFPDASAVKNLPAMQKTQETWVQFLGQEDPLVEEMAIHLSVLAWKIPRSEEPGGLQFKRSPRAGHD